MVPACACEMKIQADAVPTQFTPLPGLLLKFLSLYSGVSLIFS